MEYKCKSAPEFHPMFGWPEAAIRFKSYKEIKIDETFIVKSLNQALEIKYSFYPIDDVCDVRCYELEVPCLCDDDMAFLGALLRHKTTLKRNFALSFNQQGIRIINFNENAGAEMHLKEIKEIVQEFKPVTDIALYRVRCGSGA